MELNAGHYKSYKCRSLLACDAGGTVYDTSRVYRNDSCSDAGTLQREEDESEKIVYIIDRKKEDEKKALVDSTTHLDDDKFNDYELHSSGSCEAKREVVLSFSGDDQIDSFSQEEPSSQNKDLYYYLVKNDDDSDTVSITQKSELSQDSNNLSDVNYFDSINSLKQYSPKEKVDDYIQKTPSFEYPFAESQRKYEPDSSKHSIGQEVSEYDFDSPTKSEIEFEKNVHKRKQKYSVKDDSLIKIKLKYQKKNPFANVKMSSILKGNTKSPLKNNKNHCKPIVRKGLSTLYNQNFEVNNHSFNNQDDIVTYKTSYHINQCSPDSRKENFQREINAMVHLNSDLTDADYFDYVQPREKVIESDMDKLLSPTIDVDFSQIFNVCQKNHVLQEKQKQNNIENQRPIDCNGNEIDFRDIQKLRNSNLLTPAEIVERELFSKSLYAKKLGLENCFNTSNDCVINDILYDQGLDYKDIEMDTNFIIMNIEVYSKQRQFNKSCTLLESLYEFNRFGGFVDENCDEVKAYYREENSNDIAVNDSLYNFSEDKFHAEPDSTSQDIEHQEENCQAHLSFNFSNKSCLLGVDYPMKSNSDESLSKEKIEVNQPPPLKIKIKRVNDENNDEQYVIDDSSDQAKVKKKKKSKQVASAAKSTKDIDRYECNDCSMKFRTKRILQSHMSEFHKGPCIIECEICHMKFRRNSAHKKHESWCKNNIVHKCDSCDKVYCYRASLLKHLKIHKTSQ